jgi:hypothetical protein
VQNFNHLIPNTNVINRNSSDLATNKPNDIAAPIKKPVGRPKLNLTAEEELERKKKRYTPK